MTRETTNPLSLGLLVILLPVTVLSACPDELEVDISLQEGAPAGLILSIADPDALRRDFPTEAMLRLYELDTGGLFLKEPLDLDGANNTDRCQLFAETGRLVLNLECKKSGVPYIVIIKVNLTDDFPTTFGHESYAAKITEGNQIGDHVIKFDDLNVTDEDCGRGRFYYNIEKSEYSDHFGFEGSEVFAKSVLDYDTKSQYILNISVNPQISYGDPGPKAYTQLVVHVEDFDDRDPKFIRSSFNLRVTEETSHADTWLNSTPAIQAYDGDTGIDTPITYAIINPYPNLDVVINNTTGEFRVNSILDRENVSVYQLEVKAQQRDKAYKYATAALTLTVVDVNDNLPQFSNLTQRVTLQDDVTDGTWVMPMTVTDLDQGDNGKNKISIKSDDSSAFGLKEVGSGSGVVVWLVVKDATSLRGQSSANLVIYATPRTPTMPNRPGCDFVSTCATRVRVTIINMDENGDENYQSPKFDQDFYAFVLVQPQAGIVSAGNITATDADDGDNGRVTFSMQILAGGDECEQAFEISSQGEEGELGEVTMTNKLQRPRLCFFKATACDNPTNINKRLCADVPIQIKVEMIEPSYDVSLVEDVPVETMVLALPIQNLTTDSQYFTIKPGYLLTSQVFDRERKDNYKVSLYHSQSGKLVSEVRVQIKDVNDNPPVPVTAVYNISLTGLEVKGQTVVTVEASDDDVGSNGDLRYSLLNGRDWFAIDQTTGVISITRIPPTIGELESLDFFVQVEDHGVPPLMSFVSVRLRISPTSVKSATSMVLPMARTNVIKKMNEIQKGLSAILGQAVTIIRVDPLAVVEDVGSILFLKAENSNGKEISSDDLRRLLKDHAQEIYDQFHAAKNEKENGDDGLLFQILFIVAACLCAVFLFTLIGVCVSYRRKSQRNKQRKSIMERLSKDIQIYDETGKNDDNLTLVGNGLNANINHSKSASVQSSSSDLHFANPAFNNDYDDLDVVTGDYDNIVHSNVGKSEETGEMVDYSNDVDTKMETSNENDNTIEEVVDDDGNTMKPFQESPGSIPRTPTTTTNTTTSSEAAPFISTINIIEKPTPANSVESVYNNVSPSENAPDFSSSAIYSRPNKSNSAYRSFDSDSGFRSDRDGQEDTDVVKSPSSNSSDSESGSKFNKQPQQTNSESESEEVATVDGDLPPYYEPEPDYAKKVRFGGPDDNDIIPTAAEKHSSEADVTGEIDVQPTSPVDEVPTTNTFSLSNTTITSL